MGACTDVSWERFRKVPESNGKKISDNLGKLPKVVLFSKILVKWHSPLGILRRLKPNFFGIWKTPENDELTDSSLS